MLRNSADGAVYSRVLTPFPARKLFCLCDDRPEQICVVQGGHVLQNRGRTLQPHPGVDVLVRERRVVAVNVPVELGEDQVVDLDELVVRVRSPPVLTNRVVQRRNVVHRAAVVVQLTARPARAFCAGRAPPVVLVAKAVDPLRRHPEIKPDLLGLVVAIVDGDVQALALEPHVIHHEIKRPVAGFLLEVVAEAEVAEHLKQRQMRGVAHLVDIGRTEAFLGRGHARVRRL